MTRCFRCDKKVTKPVKYIGYAWYTYVFCSEKCKREWLKKKEKALYG